MSLDSSSAPRMRFTIGYTACTVPITRRASVWRLTRGAGAPEHILDTRKQQLSTSLSASKVIRNRSLALLLGRTYKGADPTTEAC